MAAAQRSTWTDSRLDDLHDATAGIDGKFTRLDKKVGEGFARMDGKIDEGADRLDRKIDEGLGRLDGRIDQLHHSMVAAFVALISIIAVLLTAFLTVVSTRL